LTKGSKWFIIRVNYGVDPAGTHRRGNIASGKEGWPGRVLQRKTGVDVVEWRDQRRKPLCT
jgi:hypothetical protein